MEIRTVIYRLLALFRRAPTRSVREWLLQALKESDERRRVGRAERIVWLSLHESTPSAYGGRTETMQLLHEARETFVDGHFVAALLLAVFFIEHSLVEELQLHGLASGGVKLDTALSLAREHNLFPEDWLRRLDRLRLLRNPFAHRKNELHEHSMGARFRTLGKHPQKMLQEDAEDALDLMYSFFTATLREIRG